MLKPLTDTYMDTFVKDYHERLHAIQVEEAASASATSTAAAVCAGSSQQGAYAPIHPMQMDYMMGHYNWMKEVSDQEYWNLPPFGPELTEAVCLNRRAITGSFDRFDGSEEAMD